MLVCHQLQSNAYRILGVSPASTSLEIHQAAEALVRSAMQDVLPPEFDCFGEITRGAATISSALATLSDPWERLQHRLLWFHGLVCLQDDQCAGPWTRAEPIETAHDHALRVLVAADLSRDRAQMISALRGWDAFLATPEYWEFLAQCESQAGFEPAATAADVDTLRESAVTFAAESLMAAARDARAQKTVDAVMDAFPEKLPLFPSDGWRVAAALTVLVVLVVACLAGSDGGSVAEGAPPSLPSSPRVSSAEQQQSKPSVDAEPKAAEIAADPVTIKLRVLLMQIHAEERTAQQIERQLGPLHHELESLKGSAATQPQPGSGRAAQRSHL